MAFREHLVAVVGLATLLIGLDASLAPRDESGLSRPAPARIDVTDGEPGVETDDVDDLEPCDLGHGSGAAATGALPPMGADWSRAAWFHGHATGRRGPAAAIRGPPARA